jgi:hypothetical protein
MPKSHPLAFAGVRHVLVLVRTWLPAAQESLVVSKDDVIRQLSAALQEALVCGWVENVVRPPYRVPDVIEGDRWHWVHAGDKDKASAIICAAVQKAAQHDP